MGKTTKAAAGRGVFGLSFLRRSADRRADDIALALAPALMQFGSRLGESSRLRQTWTAAIGSGDEALGFQRETITTYGRRLATTSPIAATYNEAMVKAVVGPGIYPRGDTPESRLAADLFWDWADTNMGADLCRTRGFGALQADIFREMVEVGYVCPVRVRAPDGHPGGIAIQVFEAERIKAPTTITDKNLATSGGRLIDGVEVDAYGRVIGVHIAPWNDRGTQVEASKSVRLEGDAVGGPAMLLSWRKRIGQTIGLPMLAPVMNRLAGAEEYVDAVEVAAKLGACLAAVFKSNSPAAVQNALQTGTEEMGYTQAVEVMGSSSARGSDSTSRALAGLAAGSIVGLLPDEDVKTVSQTQPGAQYQMFLDVVNRFASGVTGVPVEVAGNDFTRAPFSVARMAMLLAERTATPIRDQFIRAFLDPVFRWFVRHMQATGALPAGEDAFRAMIDVVWVGPKRMIVDPSKESAATATELDQRLTTMQAVHEERGQDWEQVLRQAAKEEALMKELGVERAAPPGSAPKPDPDAPGADVAAPPEPKPVDANA